MLRSHLRMFVVLGLIAPSLFACKPKVGPTPLVEQFRVSRANPEGTQVAWGRIQVHYKDAKPGAKKRELMDKLTEEVTFQWDRSGDRTRVIPALVPRTAEHVSISDSTWKDRFAVDFVVFPRGMSGRGAKLHVRNYYQAAEEEHLLLPLEPSATPAGMPRVERVRLRPESSTKDRVEVILDRDAPSNLTAWHYLDGRVFPMKAKGRRIFFRAHTRRKKQDHLVILAFGKEWLSPPVAPSPDEEEEDVELDGVE